MLTHVVRLQITTVYSRRAARRLFRKGHANIDLGLGTIMPQIVHRPAVFNDEERYPFGVVLGEENPRSENQGKRFYNPKNHIKNLFVARLDFVVGDIAQKFPHGFVFFTREPNAFGFGMADDRDVLRWGDAAARCPVVAGLDGEAFGGFVGAGEAEASTHGKAV